MQLDIEFEISCANLNHFMIVLAKYSAVADLQNCNFCVLCINT